MTSLCFLMGTRIISSESHSSRTQQAKPVPSGSDLQLQKGHASSHSVLGPLVLGQLSGQYPAQYPEPSDQGAHSLSILFSEINLILSRDDFCGL